MQRIEGKEISSKIIADIQNSIDSMKPKMAALYAGDDPSTLSYIKGKTVKAAKCGIALDIINMSEDVSENDFFSKLSDLCADASIDGIIVEKPLPAQISIQKVSELISYKKDIDCISPVNLGRLITEDYIIAPSTAMAVINILKYSNIETSGSNITIIGRSEIVGKPLTLLLESKKSGNATVTLTHSKTKNIKSSTSKSDIIVVAIGKPNFLTADYIGDNLPVIIDVGINYVDGRLTGDAAAEAFDKSSFYTPVPGGVGPVTVATLFQNLVRLKENYG